MERWCNHQIKHSHSIIQCCLILFLLTISVNAAIFDGERFSEVLQDFADKTLRIDKMQRYLDYDVNYDAPIHPDGEEVLNEIVDQEISPMLRNLIEAVTNLRDSVQETLNNPEGTYTLAEAEETPFETLKACCTLNEQELKNEKDFQGEPVNTEEVCVLGRGLTSPNAKFLKTQRILAAMERNREVIPQIKWQYIGFEWNYMINNPASKICQKDDNPVWRPWYKAGASPKPKNIVLVCDRSQSMSGNLMDHAKSALRSVLHTLGPDDKVAVVFFNQTIELAPVNKDTQSDCYQSKFAAAIPRNVKHLEAFINGTSASGGSQYIPALKKAFSFFREPQIMHVNVKLYVLSLSNF